MVERYDPQKKSIWKFGHKIFALTLQDRATMKYVLFIYFFILWAPNAFLLFECIDYCNILFIWACYRQWHAVLSFILLFLSQTVSRWFHMLNMTSLIFWRIHIYFTDIYFIYLLTFLNLFTITKTNHNMHIYFASPNAYDCWSLV